MQDLTNKVAIVTGSTRGIGKAIALALARAGAAVIISGRKPDACATVADEFRAEHLKAEAIPCHVGYREELASLVDDTVARFGRIDILVCNAAVNPQYGPMREVSDEVFDKIMNTNVRGVFQLCNLTCPIMRDGGGGSVILISSIAGLRGSTTIGTYGISKAAQSGLVRHLAVEWGPHGIRCNAIAPGLIRTDFSQRLLEDPVRQERARMNTPLRRIGEPEDVAGVALFLASSASAYVTGQTIVADGGETIAG